MLTLEDLIINGEYFWPFRKLFCNMGSTELHDERATHFSEHFFGENITFKTVNTS